MKLIDILNAPWAIHPAKLDEIQGIYVTHMRGEKIDLKAIEAQLGRPLANEDGGYEVVDGVAVLPIDGVISKKMNLLGRISGGSSIQLLARDFRAALEDVRVHAILFQVDSPGGSIDGVHELAREIFAARGKKPIVALADSNMASAAYWLGSAADSIYIAGKTTLVGSLGVVMKHVDVSKREDVAGVKTTEIYAGKYKRLVSDFAPLTPEGKGVLQALVDKIYSVMVDDVAAFRGVDTETVIKDMAEGRLFVGVDAIEAGLVDGVSTIEALIADLATGSKPLARITRPAAGGAAAAATVPAVAGDASGELVQTSVTHKGNEMITRETLNASHADLVAAILAEGRNEGLLAGATAERERILAVEAQSIPGHEQLIAKLKADGKTTGAEAAVQVLAAEKAKTAARGQQSRADAPAPLTPTATVTGDPEPKPAPVQPGVYDEAKLKAHYEADAATRAEFPTLAAFLAFCKADASGRVRILGRKQPA